MDTEIRKSRTYDINASYLHRLVSELRYRHIWNKNAEFLYDENEINQEGAGHVCVIDGKNLHFLTVRPESAPGVFVYGEVLKDPPSPLSYFETNFFIEPVDEGHAEVRFTLRASFRWKILLLLLPVLKKRFSAQAELVLTGLETGLDDFKKVISTEEREAVAV